MKTCFAFCCYCFHVHTGCTWFMSAVLFYVLHLTLTFQLLVVIITIIIIRIVIVIITLVQDVLTAVTCIYLFTPTICCSPIRLGFCCCYCCFCRCYCCFCFLSVRPIDNCCAGWQPLCNDHDRSHHRHWRFRFFLPLQPHTQQQQ